MTYSSWASIFSESIPRFASDPVHRFAVFPCAYWQACPVRWSYWYPLVEWGNLRCQMWFGCPDYCVLEPICPNYSYHFKFWNASAYLSWISLLKIHTNEPSYISFFVASLRSRPRSNCCEELFTTLSKQSSRCWWYPLADRSRSCLLWIPVNYEQGAPTSNAEEPRRLNVNVGIFIHSRLVRVPHYHIIVLLAVFSLALHDVGGFRFGSE